MPNISDHRLSAPLALGVALLPVYVFASGGIQPAHILLLLFSLTPLIHSHFKVPAFSFHWYMLALSVWIFFVESFQSVALGGETSGIASALFFLYNFIITFAISHKIPSIGVSSILVGVLLATLIALVSIVLTGVDLSVSGDTGRGTATFNNPNQLGYFSVCLLSMTYFLYASGKIYYFLALPLFASAIFLSVLSLSKAAMVANGLVSFIALKPKLSQHTLPIYVAGVTAVVYFLYLHISSGGFDEVRFFQRLINMANENDSSLESRGVFAFLEADLLGLILGVGSVRIQQVVGHEVHSTFGSMINNYGIVGLGLFSSGMAIWSVKIYQSFGLLGLVAIVGPAMLYGITHNGSRFTFFWVLVATTLGYHERTRRLPPVSAMS